MSKTRFVKLTLPACEWWAPIDLLLRCSIYCNQKNAGARISSEDGAIDYVVRESPAEILAAIAEAEGASDAPEVPDSGVVMLAVAAMRRDAEQYGGRTHDALVVVANWLERLAEGGG
jgi:hypothetical protein